MNNKFTALLGILFFLLCTDVYGQRNLQELRAEPKKELQVTDTLKSSAIKPIYVPIPKLGLEVNYWKRWTKFGLNANQASFSDNWSAGGVNSVSLLGTAWHKAEYNRDRFNFVSEMDFRYGKLQNFAREGEAKQLAKKNNDRIFWDNKLAYKMTDKWALYLSVTLESQFDVGYRYGKDADGNEIIVDTVSAFMAPGYFTESLGLEYKPDKTFSLRLGTGTARQTVILDNRIAPPAGSKDAIYGVQPGKRVKNDLAFQITANLDRNIAKNLNLKSRYNMFADYKDLGDPDHRLDATLSAKVNNFVNVSLTGILVYDSDQHKNIQYSQALALGVVYALPR